MYIRTYVALTLSGTRLWLRQSVTGVYPTPGHLGFVVDRVALGQGFSEHFGFPLYYSTTGLYSFIHSTADMLCAWQLIVLHVL
jgi:hypothetical protein